MTVEVNMETGTTPKGIPLGREANSVLIAIIIGITTYIFAKWMVPQAAVE